ncbi:MAG: leucine-rich repeat domain-containing protein [Paludibacteraceae bacterium]|nr:leucine-rich repeat domain-containing protein [Paludibacteraceae bacterium]
MRKLLFLFVALLATTCLWAYDFQVGNLYYSETPEVSATGIKGSKFWPIQVDESIVTKNRRKMVADFRPNDAGRRLYVWDGTYIINENPTGSNFHGNDESYLALLVGFSGWAGCGYCLTATDRNRSWQNAVTLLNDIVANPDDYYLHMAIKSNDNASHCFYIFGSEATKFVIGSTPVYDGPIYANFRRNGDWAEFDIPMSRFATALSTITCAPGVNIFAALSENIAGAQLNLDAVYFYKKTDIDNDTTPNYATLTGAVDNLTSITIPETITYEGTTYSVTGIGNSAFYQCISLTSVTIPNSVTSIGESAFEN